MTKRQQETQPSVTGAIRFGGVKSVIKRNKVHHFSGYRHHVHANIKTRK